VKSNASWAMKLRRRWKSMQRAAALEGRVVDGRAAGERGGSALSLPDLIPRTLDTTDLDGGSRSRASRWGIGAYGVAAGNSALERNRANCCCNNPVNG
jgi:hypothetical protein